MTANGPIDLRDYIRDIPDFPKPGILFKDITPLLADAGAFQAAVDRLAEHFAGPGDRRGRRGRGPGVPLRPAAGPPAGRRVHPDPQAGQAALLEDRPGIRPGVRDRPARGPQRRPRRRAGGSSCSTTSWPPAGTMVACRDLVRQAGAEVVACAFVIELAFLGGRARLEPGEVFSLISY